MPPFRTSPQGKVAPAKPALERVDAVANLSPTNSSSSRPPSLGVIRRPPLAPRLLVAVRVAGRPLPSSLGMRRFGEVADPLLDHRAEIIEGDGLGQGGHSALRQKGSVFLERIRSREEDEVGAPSTLHGRGRARQPRSPRRKASESCGTIWAGVSTRGFVARRRGRGSAVDQEAL